jgi:hypothetical protein
MTDLTLSKTETKLLLAAAEQEGGLLVLPEAMKPVRGTGCWAASCGTDWR